MERTQVSAVVVTRGDVDLTEIAASLVGFDEMIVWNNALERDLSVYGRYAGVRQARNPVVFVQDDDCRVSDIDALLDAYVPGEVVANMPVSRWDDYPDSCLVGWGAVFDRDLPEVAFGRLAEAGCDGGVLLVGVEADRIRAGGYVEATVIGEWFLRTCDVVFSTLTPHRKVDLGFQHLPWAEDPARAMFKQAGHRRERDRMLALARSLRDRVPS